VATAPSYVTLSSLFYISSTTTSTPELGSYTTPYATSDLQLHSSYLLWVTAFTTIRALFFGISMWHPDGRLWDYTQFVLPRFMCTTTGLALNRVDWLIINCTDAERCHSILTSGTNIAYTWSDSKYTEPRYYEVFATIQYLATLESENFMLSRNVGNRSQKNGIVTTNALQ
jgi:hypothetical protein